MRRKVAGGRTWLEEGEKTSTDGLKSKHRIKIDQQLYIGSNLPRPWNEFQVKVSDELMELFRAATHTHVGNEQTTSFSEDRWLHGFWI